MATNTDLYLITICCLPHVIISYYTLQWFPWQLKAQLKPQHLHVHVFLHNVSECKENFSHLEGLLQIV